MDNSTHISVPDDVRTPTGDSDSGPMTPAQASHLKALSAEAGVPADLGLNRADAAKRIEELERTMGRGGGADA